MEKDFIYEKWIYNSRIWKDNKPWNCKEYDQNKEIINEYKNGSTEI